MMEVICWLLLAAIFIVLEIISLGLTTIWFAGGAFVAAIAGLCGVGLPIQVILFLVVSVVLLILTRPIALAHLNANTEKTNSEALVGQKAVVQEEINNLKETGKVKINGMEWTARASSDDEIISVESVVTVVDIRGVKLIVETMSEKESVSQS